MKRSVNLNVHIDKQTAQRLERLARIRRTSRDAIIREVLAHLLGRRAKAEWPPEVLGFQGIPDAASFDEAAPETRRAARP